MKCTNCGAALDGKHNFCECGKRIEMPGRGIEIEYKEFKISEFLEIRKKQEKSHSSIVRETGGKGIKNPERTPSGALIEQSRFSAGDGKKSFFFVAIMITVVAVAMAGAFFYLPRFFLQW